MGHLNRTAVQVRYYRVNIGAKRIVWNVRRKVYRNLNWNLHKIRIFFISSNYEFEFDTFIFDSFFLISGRISLLIMVFNSS
jgi:hypothetical protein